MRLPQRFQLSRRAGWRMPEGGRSVARPTRYGNPWQVLRWGGPGDGWFVRGPGDRRTDPFGTKAEAQAEAVRLMRCWVIEHERTHPGNGNGTWRERIDALRGLDLGCWCRLDDPCHADLLLDFANPGRAEVRALAAHRFLYASEADLQAAVHAVVGGDREIALTPGSRIDVLTGAATLSRVGVEVKVDGPVSAVVRQLDRYAASGIVEALVLVTNRARHTRVPETLHGVPVYPVLARA